jgi:hypothetical protein
LRYRNSELHFENTGCHPNLRSLQLSLFLSVSNLGSTPDEALKEALKGH